MNMVKAMAAAIAACGLVACDGDGAPRKVTSIKPSSEYVDKLRSLSEANRGLALRRAIQDSRQTCKKPLSSGYQEDYKNLSMWTIRCTDRRDYALFIAPSGDVQVRPCHHLAQLKLPVCRFDDKPA